MRPIRIALSGKMRSGKDTLANELVMRHGFVRMSFADKLKEVAGDLFGVSETSKNRALLIELSRRLSAIDAAVWIKQVIDRIPMYQSVVVTDMRYPNEYHTLRGLGFLMVRIEVDSDVQMRRILATDSGMDMALRGDASETSLDGDRWEWDLKLDGADRVEKMYREVRLLLEHLAVSAGVKEEP